MSTDLDRSDEYAEWLAADELREAAVRNGEHPDDPGPSEPPADADPLAAATPTASANGVPERAVDGAAFILDRPPSVDALWGTGAQVLWAPGEALMIAGPQGVGKTTLMGLLVRALIGCGDGDVLGLPVAEVGRRVLYLAMDRPRQIARSLGRQFTEDDRAVLAELLVVRPGPPPADLAAQPTLLVGMAENYGAEFVFVDSLKDAALGLTKDEVAAGYNRARQFALSEGVEVVESHHTRKPAVGNSDGAGSPVDAVYGSVWLTSGAGSVVLLAGEPGDAIVGFRHVKQPAEEVGPFRLLHDQAAGLLTVEHSIDLVALVKASGPDGLTARGAAQAITEKPNPSRGAVEKARRKLSALAAEGVLVMLGGSNGGPDGGSPAAWFLAENRSRSPE
jgi:hypothetical protein